MKRSLIHLCSAGWCLAALAMLPAFGQLAVTEVMSSASRPAPDFEYPDFWELTNFGAHVIDLSEYRFTDDAGLNEEVPEIFQGVLIGPGESIILMRRRVKEVIQTPEEFRAWWGESKLPPNLQVIFYPRPGFASTGDMVQLWRVSATSTTLVDRVTFYEAQRGFTFTYDPATGVLDSLSEPGVDYAFQAVESEDVGSPGWTTGPVSLAILDPPQSLEVDAGTPATFRVRAHGLPKPRYQWLFNGEPIPGATEGSLTIEQTTPGHEGAYSVELENGLETLLSATANLEVNTNSSCARIVVPPLDILVTPEQTAIFTVDVRGYPLPSIQWHFQGFPLAGATNRTLSVPDVNTNSAGAYRVEVTNPLCTTNATAFLAVTPKPRLLITEVMTNVSTNSVPLGCKPWWELTNFDDYPVNLRGYRWDDFPSVLEGAVTITNDVVMQPGESVIFCQNMTPEAFIQWWGEENLPENVQIIRYTGNGFQATGDSIRLWNATALDPGDFIASKSFVNVHEDFTPIRGVSLTFWCDGPLEDYQSSVLGECGAIRAAGSDDIGSPGYVINHPPRTLVPRILRISRDAQGVQLTCKTQSGKRYLLQFKNALGDPSWTPLSEHLSTGAELNITDGSIEEARHRFYRLILLPDLP